GEVWSLISSSSPWDRPQLGSGAPTPQGHAACTDQVICVPLHADGTPCELAALGVTKINIRALGWRSGWAPELVVIGGRGPCASRCRYRWWRRRGERRGRGGEGR